MKKNRNKLLLYHPSTPYMFLLPALIFFLAASYIPIFSTMYLSFHKWNILDPSKPFVGLDNYISLFKDRTFMISVENTLKYVIGMIAVGVPFPLLLAIGATSLIKPIKNFVFLSFFIPLVSSMVAVGLIWVWIYHPSFGLMNIILETLNLPTFNWLTDPKTALLAIIIMSLWKSIGYNMIIFLAGIQSIPEMYYEAAGIDGASGLQKFRFITLPLLMPTTLFVFITTMIGSFQVFTQVYVMTSRAGQVPGGPAYSTRTLVLHIYEIGFTYLRMGRASAIAMLFLIVILILTLLQLRLFRKQFTY